MHIRETYQVLYLIQQMMNESHSRWQVVYKLNINPLRADEDLYEIFNCFLFRLRISTEQG